MWRLPFEIMGEIFEYYVAPGGDGPTNEGNESNKNAQYEHPAPTTLCLVCRCWRTVAMALPVLWADVTIRAQQQYPGQAPRVKSIHVHGISSRMNLLGTYPWSLTVHASQKRYIADRDFANATLLSQLLDRPAKLSLKRLTVSADPFAIGMGHITFPSVTSVVILCRNWPGNPNPDIPDLPSLPNLTQAILSNISTPKYIPSHIPWSQLTHLFIDGDTTMDVRQWQAIFKLCTSLQRGCFRNFYDLSNEITYPEPPDTTLPNLTELAFLGASPFEEPLHRLSLPSLKKLQMFTNWHAPAWDFTHPDLFNNLTHLTLVGHARVSANTFLDIFNTTPLLTELFFLVTKDLEEICEYLKFNLPRLTALGMYMETYLYRPLGHVRTHESGVLPFPYRAFAELAHSRTQAVQKGHLTGFDNALGGVAALQHLVLRVDSQPKWAGEIVGKLREAVDPGLFASYGLRVSVFGDCQWASPVCFSSCGVKHLGGDPPLISASRCKHWDEGFEEFIDGVEEYSLFPKAEACG